MFSKSQITQEQLEQYEIYSSSIEKQCVVYRQNKDDFTCAPSKTFTEEYIKYFSKLSEILARVLGLSKHYTRVYSFEVGMDDSGDFVKLTGEYCPAFCFDTKLRTPKIRFLYENVEEKINEGELCEEDYKTYLTSDEREYFEELIKRTKYYLLGDIREDVQPDLVGFNDATPQQSSDSNIEEF